MELPEIQTDDFENQVNNKSVVIVDARYSKDYVRGRVPRAISIPIDSRPGEVGRTLAPFSKSTPVIVYCQSVGCKFDERIAAEIIANAFQDVSVFPGGWREWKRIMEKKTI